MRETTENPKDKVAQFNHERLQVVFFICSEKKTRQANFYLINMIDGDEI
jgi:hypothetical protein